MSASTFVEIRGWPRRVCGASAALAGCSGIWATIKGGSAGGSVALLSLAFFLLLMALAGRVPLKVTSTGFDMSEAEARGAAEAWHTAEESIKVSVQRGETIEELLRRFAAEESREYSEKRAADQQMAWRKFHEWKSKRMRAMSGSQIERMLKTGELAESAFSDEMWKLGFMYRDLEERPWLHSSAFSGLKDEAWNAWRREFNFAESDRFEAMNYEYTYERRNPQRD